MLIESDPTLGAAIGRGKRLIFAIVVHLFPLAGDTIGALRCGDFQRFGWYANSIDRMILAVNAEYFPSAEAIKTKGSGESFDLHEMLLLTGHQSSPLSWQ